ncbi:MAG: radical SAM family heme chaperone HemW [Fermentimonas sp.]|jgi:oxygen-independent coproporphyrinogen-3 oxidase
MSGIYIHIPFCKTRCNYCDFYKTTDERLIDGYVEALCKEIYLRKTELKTPVKTIYFGGGTPSRLNYTKLCKIFESISSNYSIDTDAEITLEANPDDLTTDYIKMLCDTPINRLSIGVQSFDDIELKFLSRRHNALQAIDSIHSSQKHGFHNISIDLMYGLPNQTLDIWRQNLKKASSIGIQHLSAYHLIYEPNTIITRLLEQGKINPANEDLSNDMFALLIEQMTNAGFIHYEISSFAKKGFISRHNSSYWTGLQYLGFGPSAHSFNGEARSWNISSVTDYIKSINSGKLCYDSEHLSENEKYNEYILTGLRTAWGIDLIKLKQHFGDDYLSYCLENAKPYIESNKISIEQNTMKLTSNGIFTSDGIMSDLMIV